MTKKNRNSKTAKGAGAGKGAQALVENVLSQIDNAFENSGDSEKKKFLEQLNEIEEKIRKSDDKKQDWWVAEINLRKGRCARGFFDKKKEYQFWKQACDCARKSGNHEVAVQSWLELGFDFYEFTTSIKEISEIHMNCIRAICAQGEAIHTRLRIVGTNLFNFWRQIEFRRLAESDLKAKQLIIDGAKSLEKAGFDEDRAAPVMIMLLSKVFEFDDPAIEWARLETAVLDVQIPEDVKRKVESLMPKFPAGEKH